jgi:hypothetical protein
MDIAGIADNEVAAEPAVMGPDPLGKALLWIRI